MGGVETLNAIVPVDSRSLVVFISLLFALTQYLLKRSINQLDADQREQNVRLDRMEADVHTYRQNVAVGMSEFRNLMDKLNSHIEREENITWKRMEREAENNAEVHAKIFLALEVMKTQLAATSGILSRLTDHIERHDKEAEQRELRIARIEERERVRKKNGGE